MTPERKAARERSAKRRQHRFEKHLRGDFKVVNVPGYQPRSDQMTARATEALTRVVKRKLRQGRPGRPSDAPRSDFDWEKVVNASQKRRLRLTKTRKNWWGRITMGGLG